jgi:hypothetical protein
MGKTIEIVTFRLKDGVTQEAFVKETIEMETSFLGKLKGFIDRDTGVSNNGDWVVVLHWESAEDAEASMEKFVDAPGAQSFTALIDMDTFEMKRFALADHYE